MPGRSLPPIRIYQIADQQCSSHCKSTHREVKFRIDVAGSLRPIAGVIYFGFHLIHLLVTLEIDTVLAPTNKRNLQVREYWARRRCDRIHQVGSAANVPQPAGMSHFVCRNEGLIGWLCFDDNVVVGRSEAATVREYWRSVRDILNDEHDNLGTQADHAPKAVFEFARRRRQLEIRAGEPPIVEKSARITGGVQARVRRRNVGVADS